MNKDMEPVEQYINFSLGDQFFALRIDQVHEIIRMVQVTTVPFGSPEIRGFASLYGNVVSVVSLRVLLGMPEQEDTPSTRIIVVPYRGGFVPLIVDMVDSVVTYDYFEEPAEEHRSFMVGVFDKIGFREDHRAGILNLDILLSSLVRS